MSIGRKRCITCNQLTFQWQRINGGSWHCYDGCYSTTGRDNRTTDGHPAWLPYGKQPAWDPARLWSEYWKKMRAESAERNAARAQKAQAIRERKNQLQRERRARKKLLVVV